MTPAENPVPPPGPPPEARRPGDAFRGHRARDAAVVLPVAGLVLIAPPVINFFLADLRVLGAPLIGVYLFSVWGLLVLCAWALSRRLEEDDSR